MQARLAPLTMLPRTLLALALLTTGCRSLPERYAETVRIESVPAGATVYLDGKAQGRTPLRLELVRSRSHLIRLEREGYRPAFEYILPELSDNLPFVRLGPLVDAGAYARLAPNPMRVELSPLVVPGSIGAQPFEEFSYRVMQADALRETGRISAEEHAYVIHQLIDFFGPYAGIGAPP